MKQHWTGFHRLRHVQHKRKHHLIFVPKVHQRPKGQALRDGKLQWLGSNSFRQRPSDVRRLAGIAGILPVYVPTSVDFEIEPGVSWFPGSKSRDRNHQLHMHMRRISGFRHRVCGQSHG